MPSNQFARTVEAARSLTLPWLLAAVLILGLDVIQPRYPQELAQTLIRMGRLYLMAGFAYTAWSQMTGKTEEPMLQRFFVRSLWLFLFYFVMNVAVNIAGSVVAMVFPMLGQLGAALGLILLTLAQQLILFYFLAAAAGCEFAESVQGMRPLFQRTKPWALALVLANPGLTLLCGFLLSGMDPGVQLQGAIAATGVQHLVVLFVLMGLIRVRTDMDSQAQTGQNETTTEPGEPS